MKMNQFKKIFLGILIALALIISGGFIYLNQNSYPASEVALSASKQGDQEKQYDFYTSTVDSETAIIFYPGAFVDSASYSIWATDLSNQGIDVYILKVPFDLAVLSANSPQKVIDTLQDQKIILGGHSLGGVMASRFAEKHPDEVDGVIFLASYPDKKGELKTNNIPALSITATNDKILNQNSYNDSKEYLPEQVTFVKIEGGNHSGFGSYGLQKKDGTPTLSNNEQQKQISDAIEDWLTTIK